METLKQTIKELQDAVKAAQDKQKLADSEVKKLQRDMDEFKNNKDGKIDELKVIFRSLFAVMSLPLTCCIGEHLEAEGGTSEACRQGQDTTKGTPNGET